VILPTSSDTTVPLASPGNQQTGLLEYDWYDAKTALTIEGQGYRDLLSTYDRLPARALGVVRDEVWDFSHDSAGIAVRFISNTREIRARWTLTNTRVPAANMTPIGASGLDLYVKSDARNWHWLGVGRPSWSPISSDLLISHMPAGVREYLLYLPLCNGVKSIEIGVEKGASISGVSARRTKPIVFYGTSITQGYCASRAGMTYVAMLGRWLDREVINLGLPGNGRLEPTIADLLAEIDASAFVIDCLPNMSEVDIQTNLDQCVRTIRNRHPSTPILLVEDRIYADAFLHGRNRQHNETNQKASREAFSRLQRDKIGALYYLKADNLLAADGEDTIDGSHPTDLGFSRMAREFQKALQAAGISRESARNLRKPATRPHQ
jgi:GDSL-like Lipase/Acylhydrolase family/N-terminus of Esterase_SGNH_hydro-type